ncbi:MAG: bifunctional phosphopantothenoylcysteine decarboxylase/phosphopantothenate--cysteine ligase CoaBC [Bacteroidaceae bacterium]|nr:bifunctional phosphopantothenoylcysteine decarboxylase/phosphopantothenate--cysteine ligase CoaBC [Bacteroidaceae bacterium]
MLKGKKIVLGITGSIAAYKACYLIRGLVKQGAEVQVVITPAGKEFITLLTLSTLTGKPVISDFFDRRDGSWHSHVNLGLWADVMIIAPATASTMAKMANGIADNMLITTYLSMRAPVFIVPAMDVDMYMHPSTQNNIEKLRSYGNHILEAKEGELASHLVGKGRMEEPENIILAIDEFLDGNRDLEGQKILITAGPTYERIDPVRFIGNFSSGKMGLAIADECARRGADVTLIAGPVSLQTVHSNIRRIDVESADEMFHAVKEIFDEMNAAVLCAAVADFKPKQILSNKIKREKGELSIKLDPTDDIAAYLGKVKREDQKVVGFALETNNEEANAVGKLKRKNFDFIVLNSLQDAGSGFRYDTNKISIIDRSGCSDFELKPKTEVAKDIIDRLVELLAKRKLKE